MGNHQRLDTETLMSVIRPFEQGKSQFDTIRLRNITRLDFDSSFIRCNSGPDYCIDRQRSRGKLLAHLISAPIQLKYLRIDQFEWLVDMVEYASDDLRENAMKTIQYVEFLLPSCNSAQNELIHTGKKLVPFLSTYMPHLRTLRFWRNDDFPWTSVRPNYERGALYYFYIKRWYRHLKKPESIEKHVAIFEEDLRQLVGQMKELTFLDIHGRTFRRKVTPYYKMVQALFPSSQIDVNKWRFRLWL